ncbi:MAG: YeeE/YedE family protein [Gemmatimonadota bacterium]|nr:YeeE/YedE family protein [Gemmatimonadota bacterium]
MTAAVDLLSRPWPWYVAGPLIGLVVPALLVWVGRPFGISSSFRDVCAATIPGKLEYFGYDWKEHAWRLAFSAGVLAGGFLAWQVLGPADPGGLAVAVSEATRSDLLALGITDQTGLVPRQLLSWEALGSVPGLFVLVIGGFLVGFGTRWADGCTSGHAITGLANLQLASLIAVIGFFAGGLISTHWLLPILLAGLP